MKVCPVCVEWQKKYNELKLYIKKLEGLIEDFLEVISESEDPPTEL